MNKTNNKGYKCNKCGDKSVVYFRLQIMDNKFCRWCLSKWLLDNIGQMEDDNS